MSSRLIKQFKQLYNKVSSKNEDIAALGNSFVNKLNGRPKEFKNVMNSLHEIFSMMIVEDEKNKTNKIDVSDQDVVKLLIFVNRNSSQVSKFECAPPLAPGDLTFDDIAGQDETKNRLRVSYVLPFEFPNLFRSLGKGTLLYGVPGTGKSMIAKASVNEIEGAAFFNVSPADIRGKYEGETEKNIQKVFECAKEYIENPENEAKFSIIFFDEFDAIASERGDNPSMQRSVNMLLQVMDGIDSSPNVSVLAATNYPSTLDGAILRRFTTRIFVDIPDKRAREYIIREVLAETYSNPNFSRKYKKGSIWEMTKENNKIRKRGKDGNYSFATESNYQRNIDDYSAASVEYEGKGWISDKTVTKQFDNGSIDKLVQRFGPNPDGEAIIKELKSGKNVEEDDSRLNKPHIFGYSPSDIRKIMDIAVSNSSMRALGGYATEQQFNIKGGGGKNTWWVFNPEATSETRGAIKISEMDSDDKEKLLNFDIRFTDIEAAMHSYPSTIENDKYLYLLKYNLQLVS